MWMNTECVVQSEVRREKQVSPISVSTDRESRKVVQTNPFAGWNGDTDIENRHVDTVGGWGKWDEFRE